MIFRCLLLLCISLQCFTDGNHRNSRRFSQNPAVAPVKLYKTKSSRETTGHRSAGTKESTNALINKIINTNATQGERAFVKLYSSDTGMPSYRSIDTKHVLPKRHILTATSTYESRNNTSPGKQKVENVSQKTQRKGTSGKTARKKNIATSDLVRECRRNCTSKPCCRWVIPKITFSHKGTYNHKSAVTVTQNARITFGGGFKPFHHMRKMVPFNNRQPARHGRHLSGAKKVVVPTDVALRGVAKDHIQHDVIKKADVMPKMPEIAKIPKIDLIPPIDHLEPMQKMSNIEPMEPMLPIPAIETIEGID